MNLARLGLVDCYNIDNILVEDDTYNSIADDYTPSQEEFTIAPILQNEGVYVLGAYTDSFLTSCFIFIPKSTVCFEGHMAVHKFYRGKPAIILGQAAIQWMWSNTKAEKLVGYTPTSNTGALTYIKELGFEEEGRLTKSFLKNGTLIDQVITGLNREGKV